jgi:hypothetical protein
MNTLLLIGIVIVLVLVLENYQIENFRDTSKYNKFKLNEQLRDHLYLEFLERLNNSYQSKIKGNTKGPFKVICDDNKNKSITKLALSEAFDKESSTNLVTQETIRQLVSQDPVVYKSQIDTDTCIHKADNLCQHTSPGNYLNITTKSFPSRHLGPYKNAKLSKMTDLNCWNKMYSCCIKKL